MLYFLWNLTENRPATVPEIKSLMVAGLLVYQLDQEESIKLSPYVVGYCVRPLPRTITGEPIDK